MICDVIFSTYQTVVLVIILCLYLLCLTDDYLPGKPHCVDTRDVDSRHHFNECQLDPTEGWLSVFFTAAEGIVAQEVQ